jgi:ABC-2 type transport system ATP-binding protein
VSDRYGSRVALSSVDLDISSGVTALLGPNGAGKTTLLHLICGLRQPSAGSLSILGVDATSRTARRRIAQQVGFLPQAFGYLPSYSARDFVTYAAWLKRVPAASRNRMVDSALAEVDLLDRADSTLRTLSGGMVRRVGIAAALVHRPRLLVLDEPAAGLDPQQRVELRGLLPRLTATTSVILSTHLMEDLRTSTDTVVILDKGHVLFVGSNDELEFIGAADELSDGGASRVEQGYLEVLRRGVRERT